jgi:hypothetical protein
MASNGAQITLPDGKQIDSVSIGAEFVVDQSGQIPECELLDEDQLSEYEDFAKKQSLVRASLEGTSTSVFIDLVIREISEEISHLKFERQKAMREGKNFSNFTMARIASLKSLADTLLKKLQTSSESELDFKSPVIQKMFKLWMEFFYDSMKKSGVDKVNIDLVFGQIQSDLPDWEKRLIEELKSK